MARLIVSDQPFTQRSDKSQSLAQLGILGPQFFSQGLAQPCILFLKLKKLSYAIKRWSRCGWRLFCRACFSGVLGTSVRFSTKA